MTGERALSRRAVLRGVCAAAATVAVGDSLSGCTSSSSSSHRGQPTVNAPQTSVQVTSTAADVRLLTAALADEQRLYNYVSGTIGAYPALAEKLSDVRTVQRQHVFALRRALGRPPPGPPGLTFVPGRASGAVTQLVQELRRAHTRRTADCLQATSGPLARLFASVAASHAMSIAALSGS